jgi:diaminopimelate epimerase
LIPFAKAHACGNDFLIVTEDSAAKRDWAELTRQLCARNTGVGADGIEFFAWTGSTSGRVRLHNADGSIAEISGNGTRCVAAWMSAMIGAKAGDELRIETDAGLRICRINSVVLADGGCSIEVTTGMGIPSAARKIVTLADGRAVEGIAVSTGNPHFAIVVENTDFSVAGDAWQTVGAEICTHADFLHQTNVEFLRIVSPEQIEIRIFERGVGPTTSSGTGTSASATAAIAFHACKSPLRVVSPGGAQTVSWRGFGTELELTGPATLIARGEAWCG